MKGWFPSAVGHLFCVQSLRDSACGMETHLTKRTLKERNASAQVIPSVGKDRKWGGGALKHTWKYTLVEKVSGFQYSLGIICSESRFSELITHLILIRKQ